MKFAGQAMTLKLVVARSIAIKISPHGKSRGKATFVYRETAIFGLLTPSAALVLISTWELEGNNYPNICFCNFCNSPSSFKFIRHLGVLR